MKDLADLLDDLSDAMNQALWDSGQVLDAAAALEQVLGEFRISIDLILPQSTERNSSALAVSSNATALDVLNSCARPVSRPAHGSAGGHFAHKLRRRPNVKPEAPLAGSSRCSTLS